MVDRVFIHHMTRSLEANSKKPALYFFRQDRLETHWTYGDIDRYANRMARYLLQQGIAAGDRVFLCLPKCPAFVPAYLAVLKVGAIAVPLNPGFKQGELAYLAGDAKPKLALAGIEQSALLRTIDPNLEIIALDPALPFEHIDFLNGYPETDPESSAGPQDPALIIYTSGTTGNPKGAVLTQANLISDAQNIIAVWEIGPDDTLCHALPLFHIHGLCFALHTSLLTGGRVVMQDVFTPAQVLDRLRCTDDPYRCTVFMAVPAMYVRLLNHMGDNRPPLKHLRLLASGSAPLLPKNFARISEVFGKAPVEREGMSETGMNFSNPLHGQRKPGSIGFPLPSVAVRVVDPATHADVTPGATGEFWLKSPSITPGYWQKPEATAEAFQDGWFRSGDLGYVDEAGYYFLTDRLKHIIISGGENISPKEIETVINQMDAVAESAVVGIADESWGERVVAAVVAKPGVAISPGAVQDFCKARLHAWKCPKQVVIADALPRNTMGKVLIAEVKKTLMPE